MNMEKSIVALAIMVIISVAMSAGTFAYIMSLSRDIANLSQSLTTISESLASISASLENLTGIKPTPTPTFTPVTIPMGYRLTETTITLVKGGFLEKYGIIPILVPYASGVEMRDGVIVGDIAFGELGTGPTITAMTKATPDDIVILGVYEAGGEKYSVVVRADSPYQSFDDLLGKIIAIKVGSGCYTAFLRYIIYRGWTLDDFQVVDIGEAEALSALEAGSVDAVIYWEPIPTVLVAKGIGRRLMDFGPECGIQVYNPVYLVANKKWVQEHRDATIRFLAAFIESQYFLRDHPEAAARIVYETLKAEGIEVYSAEVYKESLQRHEYPTFVSEEIMNDTDIVAEFLYEQGKIDVLPDIRQYVDNTYIQEALSLVEAMSK